MLLSLFCGAGGLDLGFETAGFSIGLAFDKKRDSVNSYNHNRIADPHAHCEDVRDLTVARLDELWGSSFAPDGVIGGPPCQSFSQANRSVSDDDPRHELPLVYARLVRSLNERSPLKFIALENVPGLNNRKNLHHLVALEDHLRETGFTLFRAELNSKDYQTSQSRRRLFVIGINTAVLPGSIWQAPPPTTISAESVTVAAAIGDLPHPVFFDRGKMPDVFPVHQNHWCMKPKSRRFTSPGLLTPGDSRHRSFKTLAWDKPSLTVAYGNREVHVHPECQRRLSVFEAMLLQGFPESYELLGSMSSQIAQVSEAVPPRLAEAVALSIHRAIFPQPILPKAKRRRPSDADRDLLTT